MPFFTTIQEVDLQRFLLTQPHNAARVCHQSGTHVTHITDLWDRRTAFCRRKRIGNMKPHTIPYKKKFSTLYSRFEDQFNAAKTQWKKCATGHADIDGSIVPEDILNAWLRCRKLGLNPFKKPVPPILSDARLWALREGHKPMIQSAKPVMDHFCDFNAARRSLVCLFSREGALLEVRANAGYQKPAQSFRLLSGAVWTEETVGANAIGLVVTLQKPVRFFGPQHYMRAYHGETACAAPIFDARRRFIGGIALIASSYSADPHGLGMTVSMARAIESDIKKTEELEKSRTAASYHQAVLHAVPDAMIAVGEDGLITFINATARKLLRLDPHTEGGRMRDLLYAGNAALFRIVEGEKTVADQPVRIASSSGFNDFFVTSSHIRSASGKTVGKMILLKEAEAAPKATVRPGGAKALFHFNEICGQNNRFVRTLHHLQLAAKSDSNVLLLGESGTGKDVFAQAIHSGGTRKNGPYIAINCASIPRDLIANELFGHSEGAFTGSRRGGNTGKFEAADCGTLFLDEIAETSLEFQAALLRVVEEKAIVRVGGTSVRPVDVRIIAATNKNILEEIRKGNFRSDLYYRLNVFTIEMTPLRDRKDDIPLLIDNFIKKYGGATGRNITRISDSVLRILSSYPWPGNIRELQNVIERMINVAQGEELSADLIPDEILHWQYQDGGSDPSATAREKEAIMQMMGIGIPRNKIAQKMNMARSTFYRKLKGYGLN